MNKKVFVIIIVISILVIGLFYWSQSGKKDASKMQINPVAVIAVPTKQQSVPTIVKSFADLYSQNNTELKSEITGTLQEILYNEGQTVAKNTLLLMINSDSQQAELKSALADEKLSQVEYHRTENLYKKGVQSKQEFDIAEATYAARQADADAAKAEVNKTQIKAPFNGVLGERTLSVGDYVTSGTALVRIVDIGNLKVKYYIPEKYLSDIRLNQEIEFTTEAYPNKFFKGKVDFISPTVDSATRNIKVEATIDNKDGALLPGLSGTTYHILSEQPNSITIPEESVITTIEGQQVFKLVPTHKTNPAYTAKQVNVEVGTRRNGYAQILTGLKPNELVVTEGHQKLRDGVPVNVISVSAKGATAE